jgi:hypothetical protein
MSDSIASPARVAVGRRVTDVEEPNLPTTAAGTDVEVYDVGDDEGLGFEGMGLDEQLTPFLAIIQGLSPQLNRSKPQYLPEARQGMILNTASGTLFDGEEGLEIVPVWREPVYTEWVPRDDYRLPDGEVIRGGGGEGGFRGAHSPDDPAVRAAIAETMKRFGASARFRPIPFRNAETEEDTTLIQQFNLGIIYSPVRPFDLGASRRALLAFTSTKIKVYQAFLGNASDIKYRQPDGRYVVPPLFAHRWRLSTVPQSNKKGDFFNWKLVLAEPGRTSLSVIRRDDPIYEAAREFNAQWRDGRVKVDYASADGGDASAEDAAGGLSDEVPF